MVHGRQMIVSIQQRMFLRTLQRNLLDMLRSTPLPPSNFIGSKPTHFLFCVNSQNNLLFSKKVLGISSGIDEIGGVRLELLGYLALAWIIVYMVIWKGLHNSGKVKSLALILTREKKNYPFCHRNFNNELLDKLSKASVQRFIGIVMML